MGKDGKPNCSKCAFAQPVLTQLSREFLNTFARVSRFRDGFGGLSPFGLGIIDKLYGDHVEFYLKMMDFIALADFEVRIWQAAKAKREKPQITKKPKK